MSTIGRMIWLQSATPDVGHGHACGHATAKANTNARNWGEMGLGSVTPGRYVGRYDACYSGH